MSSLPRAYLSQKLVQPLPTKEGVILRTVGEAANYVLALPPERAEHRNRWRHAAKLLLDQADVAAGRRLLKSVKPQASQGLASAGHLDADAPCPVKS